MSLMTALDLLTKPSREHVTQDTYRTRMVDGRPATDELGNPIRERVGERRVTITHEPLLDQLASAVASTIGGGAGRAITAKHELDVIDSDALYQLTLISSQIRDWCRMAGVEGRLTPALDLRAWYAARLATNPTDDSVYAAILWRWVGVIRSKLNPPETMDLTAPCPECSASEYTDDDGNVGPFPVKISYRPTDDDIMRTASAACKACGYEWRGSAALRALRWEIDNADTPGESVLMDTPVS